MTLANVKTIKAGDLQTKCMAELSLDVSDKTAFADIMIGGEKITPEAIAAIDAVLTQLDAVPAQNGGYTVNLSEDKKSITVAIDGM